MNQLGKKVREIRLANHLSQQQFAESLGYSHKSVVNKIESGQRDMSYEKILLMVKVYGLNIKDLEEMMPKEEESSITQEKSVIIYIHPKEWKSLKIKDLELLKVGYEAKEIKLDTNKIWEAEEVLKNKFVSLIENYQKVIVVATDLATFAVTETLSSFDIQKVFFISPIADMFQHMFNLMNDYRITEKRLKAEKVIALENGEYLSYNVYMRVLNEDDKWKTPTEVLYGSMDEDVYIENIASFLETHNARLTIKQGADHSFSGKENIKYMKNWIKQLL